MGNANGTEIKDASCPKCGCDVLIPLVKIKQISSFSGNRIQVEWPSRENNDEFARVACPQCQHVFVVKGDGTRTESPNKLFGKSEKKALRALPRSTKS